MRILCLWLAAIFTLGAAEPPTVTLPPELAQVLTDYEQAWRARDPKALASLFTDDGFVLAGGQPFHRGRAAIEKFYSGQGGPLWLRAVHYAASGDTGFILGAYRYQASGADEGKFTLTLRKQNGVWKIVSDMDNPIRQTARPDLSDNH